MRIKQTLTLVLLSLLFMGCPKKGPTKAQRIAAYLDNGWADFEADRFSGAITDFDDVLDLEAENLEARLGLGWSLLLLDDDDRAAPSRSVKYG